MNLLPPSTASPGDFYLVDLGQLIPVAAVSARAAYRIASLGAFGKDQECPFEHPRVYQLDAEGKVVEVYE